MALFGIGLDTGFDGLRITPNDPVRLVANARAADDAGLDLVSMTDHPYSGNQLDAYGTLGFVLGATNRIRGVVSVTNLACRPAPMLVRNLSALSSLSGGRAVLGLGGGTFWDEIVKLGAPRRTPGETVRMMAEAIAVVRALTGGGEQVTFDGEFYRVDGLLPAAAPTPPIWTGSVGPKSLAMTGALADGWIAPAAQPWDCEYVSSARQAIGKAAAEAGRDPADIVIVHNVFGAISDSPAPVTRGVDELGLGWVRGTVEQWVDELLGAIENHGADGFVFFPGEGTPEEQDEARARWAAEIVPAVRARLGEGS